MNHTCPRRVVKYSSTTSSKTKFFKFKLSTHFINNSLRRRCLSITKSSSTGSFRCVFSPYDAVALSDPTQQDATDCSLEFLISVLSYTTREDTEKVKICSLIYLVTDSFAGYIATRYIELVYVSKNVMRRCSTRHRLADKNFGRKTYMSARNSNVPNSTTTNMVSSGRRSVRTYVHKDMFPPLS